MPCNDGKEKGGVLAELKINFKMRYASRRKGKLKNADSLFMGRGLKNVYNSMVGLSVSEV